MVGNTINQYEFLEELGKGGMGIVYKVRDVRLNRFVAIKVLPTEKNLNEERRQRFVQEARSASALNHPNIISIYEISRHNDIDYIVMEFVDGSTLADLIPRRGLRLNDTLRYAVQIGEALAAAHAAGIIHRDLKPGNVMVNRQGRVKVLDFGLAKLVDNAVLLNESQDTLSAEFRDSYLTVDRNVVGTASYMSPEQAEGRTVDTRSDIFSFGVLLYEMLSGQRAFQANSAAATMASVLRDEPAPINELAPGAPAELERIVHRCLRKDPQRRIQHMDDLTLVLDDLRQQSDSGALAPVAAPPATAPKTSSGHVWWLVSAILVAALLGWLAGSLGRSSGPVPAGSTSLVRFAGGEREAVSPAWSPDGQWVAYSSDADGTMDIWKKPVRGGEAVAITGAPHDERSPAWSPDGRSIAYSSNADGGGIFHIPQNGGSPARLASFGGNPKWAPDGKSITFDWNGDIYVVPVPAAGTEPRPLVVGTGSTPYTAWSPDGRRLAFWHETKVDLFTVEASGGAPKPLGLVPTGEEVAGLSWSADGEWLVYSQGAFGGNKDLWRVRVNAAAGLAAGTPERLTLSATDDAECAISPDGKRIAYDVRRLERHLWQFHRDPRTGLTSGRAKRISETGQLNYYPAASPDGRLVAWTSHASGLGQLYYRDISGGKTTKVTGDWLASNREIFASFPADGKQMLFTSTLNGSYQIWQLPSLGTVSLQISHAQEPARDVAPVLSPDGSLIAFYGNLSGNWDIWLMEPGNGAQPRQLTDWPGNETYPVFSPDGSQLAFLADKDGTPDIWLHDTKSGEFLSYVNGPGQEGWCAWSPDGRFFYFASNRRGEFEVWVMPADGGEATPVALMAAPGERLPQAKLLTKFAVTKSSLIVPLESRRSELYLLSMPED